MHWEEQEQLSIILEDDGATYHQTSESEGIGILNISKRAEYIGAKLTREKLKKGNRTTLSVDFANQGFRFHTRMK